MSKTETTVATADQEQEKKSEDKKNPAIADAAKYVKRKFRSDLDPKFIFHNFEYAEEVSEKVAELADDAGLDGDTRDLLTIAGHFYPLGYVGGAHEVAERSTELFRDWAKQNNVDLSTTEGNAADWIKGAYDARQEDSLPVRLLHDAAWSWYGRKRFERRYDLLQLERDEISGREGDPVKFGHDMQDLLMNFQYLTEVGLEDFDERRRRNVADQHSNNYKIEQKEVKANTGKNFGRGIDTMYRTAFRNHITLSKIADGKANMMISINTIILSIVITVSGASLSFFEDTFYENPEFLVPIISLMMSSLIAVVFAVFSARPSVTEYRIKKDKLIKSKEASLLYFGNFLKLEKSDFVSYLRNIKHDQTSMYDDLSRDLYDLGAVMHKKYLLLTISYNTFVGGLALAVISFLIVYLLNVYS
ncbi:Pycsar system effector family protein [Neolewinella antarctica]|uniref:Pycsar effector protein domain-containing protein n=1 Tax=Neolewinella antarctica TaxID=442734 RepID=A0ABX0X603_9BACT|nr:Pycsar system effector family protein [Neolewinella antarctica]NJC24639.1 hypothetical protein [Neolewinella antarctica]